MSILRSSLSALSFARTANRLPTTAQTRTIKRWVAPTLRELRRRAKIIGPQQPVRRSEFSDWNYQTEIFAFSKRLHEEFQLPLLQTAFTQRSYVLQEEHRQRELGIEETDIQITDNSKLAAHGERIAKEYVEAYLQHSLPKVPAEGQKSIAEYLLRSETLAHIALLLGMKDLIFTTEYPPAQESLSNSLLAVIGALEQSSGAERAYLFVRDFICTQLNQRDLIDLWNIENPDELLKQVCKERGLSEPEPRLLGDCGKNTVLGAYQVGVYVDKNIIGRGFGEDIPTAIKVASLDCLQSMFGIRDSMRPFNFDLQIKPNDAKLAKT